MASIYPGIGNILFFYLCYHYGFYYYNLMFKNNRDGIKRGNAVLNKYRKKHVKSIEEQKQFLTIKNPYNPFSFDWAFGKMLVIGLIKFIFFFTIYNFIRNMAGITISLWFAIGAWLIFPLVSSLILTKFNLENSDIAHMMRWKK